MATGDEKAGSYSVNKWTPPMMIDLFASQRMLVVGTSYDGAGIVRSIVVGPAGALVTFEVGKEQRRMLAGAHGWGWVL